MGILRRVFLVLGAIAGVVYALGRTRTIDEPHEQHSSLDYRSLP